ncbi:MAG: ferritin-like domain-containing protein [Sphaerobacteraceae bacterium]|nr:MAG: ferritin-like domain-containing protein [Sphaerobacteraceae bacterium]
MKLTSLEKLFVHELKDLYSAENQLLEALPQMAKASSSNELREGFKSHLMETEEHVRRLDQIFEELNYSATGETCDAMKGLVAEGEEIIEMEGEPAVKDAALIAAAQRVEHYEIAAYGTARTIAKHLGNEKAASLLEKTLDEEAATDKKLTHLAESGAHINKMAMR